MDGDTPPEAATADILHFCSPGRCINNWLSSQRSWAKARPQQLTCHTSPPRRVPLPPSPPTSHLTQWILAPSWEVARNRVASG